jgi:hypothetical protein
MGVWLGLLPTCVVSLKCDAVRRDALRHAESHVMHLDRAACMRLEESNLTKVDSSSTPSYPTASMGSVFEARHDVARNEINFFGYNPLNRITHVN